MVALLKPEPQVEVLPVVPLRGTVVFPHVELPIVFGRPKTIAAVTAANEGNKQLVVVAQKDPRIEDPTLDQVYQVGVICQIEQLVKSNGTLHAFVRGLKRVKLVRLRSEVPYWQGEVIYLPDIAEEDEELRLMAAHLTREVRRAFSLGKGFEPMVLMRIGAGVSVAELVDQVAFALEASVAEKQKILETLSLKKRLSLVTEALLKEIQVLQLERKIERRTQSKFEKSMKRAVLEEKKKAIERELRQLGGEREVDEREDIMELRKKIKAAKMPKEVEKKAFYELERLARMSPWAPEASYIRTYLDWLVAMPWQKRTKNNVSLKRAAKILNEDHYGLKEVKERILEYLAVMELRKKQKGKKAAQGANILCFIGPPGVGKTSIGRSIARALGRKFVRVSLGGIRDEAEIRGHRRTYVGAMPGRIIQGIKNAGTKNPVFMLDEIDKVGIDFRGDPSAALLEALDPEQNKEFSDHYLEVPFDLSEVFFILTGNVLDTIPPPLRDRLEIIRFSGYTREEKYHIAKKFLVPRQIEQHGLTKAQVKFTDEAIYEIIAKYTREAGVRELERLIAKICRKIARKVAEKKKIPEKIDAKVVRQLLGPPTFTDTLKERKDEVGMATGLAWTQAGGEILFVEVALMPGEGKIYLTGKLGSVMKESCQAAVSYIRSHWKELGVEKNFTKKYDIHIHVPEGAVPKDGPSAGVAIATAVLSALTKKKVRCDLGMTGEITLRGRVLEVGGIKEKVLAAHRAGLKEVILPKANKKDLVELPKKVKRELKFTFVDNLSQVFARAFAS